MNCKWAYTVDQDNNYYCKYNDGHAENHVDIYGHWVGDWLFNKTKEYIYIKNSASSLPEPKKSTDCRDRIKERAHYLWLNRTGKNWENAESNWLEAEQEELEMQGFAVTPLQDIQHSCYQGIVLFDKHNQSGKAIAGTEFPAGTSDAPSDNFKDAKDIGKTMGLPVKCYERHLNEVLKKYISTPEGLAKIAASMHSPVRGPCKDYKEKDGVTKEEK